MSAIARDKAQKIVVQELGKAPEEALREGTPSIEAVIVFLKILDRCLARLNRQARLGQKLDVIVRETALQRGFPVFLTYARSSVDRASRCVLATWTEAAHLLGRQGIRDPQEILCGPDEALTGISEEQFRDYLSTYNLAFAEILREHMVEPRAQQTVQELVQGFDLSYDELGRVLEVSGDTPSTGSGRAASRRSRTGTKPPSPIRDDAPGEDRRARARPSLPGAAGGARESPRHLSQPFPAGALEHQQPRRPLHLLQRVLGESRGARPLPARGPRGGRTAAGGAAAAFGA
jgi:hypothetical protein